MREIRIQVGRTALRLRNDLAQQQRHAIRAKGYGTPGQYACGASLQVVSGPVAFGLIRAQADEIGER